MHMRDNFKFAIKSNRVIEYDVNPKIYTQMFLCVSRVLSGLSG